ncbi:hypothetical protein [Thiomicrorhabdus arctica]|jgi:uncharacterized membrane-anchored protein|uniref:hypothetical protein n=1 Tax=Thiomicrorhabdus arctica TaxID=131540 RepID=UPI000365780D|nr:hypothetical protein [Thiomicrorhabdus arctica]
MSQKFLLEMSGSPIQTVLSKVPEITPDFWIVRIFATTHDKIGGDAVSMSMHLSYLRESSALK